MYLQEVAAAGRRVWRGRSRGAGSWGRRLNHGTDDVGAVIETNIAVQWCQ